MFLQMSSYPLLNWLADVVPLFSTTWLPVLQWVRMDSFTQWSHSFKYKNTSPEVQGLFKLASCFLISTGQRTSHGHQRIKEEENRFHLLIRGFTASCPNGMDHKRASIWSHFYNLQLATEFFFSEKSLNTRKEGSSSFRTQCDRYFARH